MSQKHIGKPHTSARQGKRVRIVLDSGEEIIGKFQESRERYVYVDDRKIEVKHIRSFGLYRPHSSPKPSC